MAGLPEFGGFEVDEGDWNLFFGSTALGTDVVDHVPDDAVAHNDLVAAVLHDQAGTMGGAGLGVGGEGLLLGSDEAWDGRKTQSGKD